jgi:hypothetical protein
MAGRHLPPEGFGGKVVFFSKKKPDGQWNEDQCVCFVKKNLPAVGDGVQVYF